MPKQPALFTTRYKEGEAMPERIFSPVEIGKNAMDEFIATISAISDMPAMKVNAKKFRAIICRNAVQAARTLGLSREKMTETHSEARKLFDEWMLNFQN